MLDHLCVQPSCFCHSPQCICVFYISTFLWVSQNQCSWCINAQLKPSWQTFTLSFLEMGVRLQGVRIQTVCIRKIKCTRDARGEKKTHRGFWEPHVRTVIFVCHAHLIVFIGVVSWIQGKPVTPSSITVSVTPVLMGVPARTGWKAITVTVLLVSHHFSPRTGSGSYKCCY